MKRWAILALLGLLATTALAADNATLITPCGTGCVTVRAKDVGLGVQSPIYIIGDGGGLPIYGTAGTANANVLTVQGIASMTKLLVDGSGVTQPVSGTITANQGGAWTVAATQSGNWTTRIVGNAGGILDAPGQNAASPANELLIGGQFNTSPTTITSGNVSPLQVGSSGKLLVDGSGVTQPVSGTVTANAGSGTFTVAGTVTANQGGAPWSENITQFGGVALSTGTGASGTGIPRVTVANDSNILATQSGTWTVQPGNTANTTPWLASISQGGNTASVKASGTNAATTDPALVVAQSPNPNTLCTSIKPISQTASTDLITSTNKLHICAILIVSATAQSVSLVEGTVTTCGTGTAALMGATTAANGMALAANGGFTHTAERPFMVTQTTADHLCLLQSGAGNISGFISYVDHN
jgi:hypothetical protein